MDRHGPIHLGEVQAVALPRLYDTEFCAALDCYAERAMEIKRENRRPPFVPAARPAPCCTNPTPAIYLSSRRDFVEVLTECRDQHPERTEVRFVAAGARSNGTMGSA